VHSNSASPTLSVQLIFLLVEHGPEPWVAASSHRCSNDLQYWSHEATGALKPAATAVQLPQILTFISDHRLYPLHFATSGRDKSEEKLAFLWQVHNMPNSALGTGWLQLTCDLAAQVPSLLSHASMHSWSKLEQ